MPVEAPRPCCRDDANLEVRDPRSVGIEPPTSGTLVVRVCKVCGARHREWTVEPVHIGTDVAGLG